MSDLHELLDEAAGPPAGPVDLDDVKRRARRQRVLRAGAAVAVVVAVVAVAASTLTVVRSPVPTIVGEPDAIETEDHTPAETGTVPEQVPDGLTVEATRIRTFGGPSDEHRYVPAAVVRNDLADAAVQVGGRFSLHTATGRQVGTAELEPVTVLPGQQGLLIEGPPLRMPEDLGDDPQLGFDLEILTRVDDPTVPEVTVSDVDYETDPPRPCVTSGTLHNASDRDLSGLRVAMLGYIGGELYTADVADVRPLPAGGSMPFSIQTFSASGCPAPDELEDHRVLVEYPVELLRSTS